jgi:quercetin dioxygenase-like cupin family protein
MEYAKRIQDIPKKIWKPPEPGEPEPIATLLDGQDLVTKGSEGAIPGSEALTVLVQNYRPKGTHRIHAHEDLEQVFYVFDGSGEFKLGDRWFPISKGDLVFVPRNVSHGARNTSEGILVMIFISVPLTGKE